MKNGVWLAGLLLSLAGWGAALTAGESAWRTAARPAATPDTGARFVPCSSVPPPPRPGGPPIQARGQFPDQPAAGGSQFAAEREEDEAEPAILQTGGLAPAIPPLPPGAAAPFLQGDPLPPIGGLPVQAPQAEPKPEPRPEPKAEPRMPARLPPPQPESPILPPNPAGPPLSFHPRDADGSGPWYDPNTPLFWVRAEYLLWSEKADHVPPLVTTSNVADQGILGQPSTRVLFGGDNLSRDPFSGGRFALGLWFDCDHKEAVEIEGFFLGQRSSRFSANSNQFPVLGRPFFAVNAGGFETAEIVATPGSLVGTVSVNAKSSLWGLTPSYQCCLCSGCDYRVAALIGFRYLDLDEDITVTENVTGLPTSNQARLVNQQALVFDSFGTRNQFYGADFGLTGENHWGRFSLDYRGKLAVGGVHQEVTINGGQALTSLVNGQVQTFSGGLLALNSNIGRFSRDRFAVLPELDLNVGYDLTDNLRFFVGYSFLYCSSVVRAGDQIDRNLDITQIPGFRITGLPSAGQNSPMLPFKATDFWAQGVNFGFLWKW
jgi:hypothetical protein